jgi:hypothetical protein
MLREAFLWSARRTVTKTATFCLHANTYEVDAALVGRRIEVVFDPFDLTNLEVRFQGRPMGMAVVHKISRHVHPGAQPATVPAPPAATGIDYLALVADRHHQDLATRINYNDLPTTTSEHNDGDVDGDRDGDGPLEGAADITSAFERAVEVDLASMRAEMNSVLPAGVLPGQLDLADLTGFTGFTPDHDEDLR